MIERVVLVSPRGFCAGVVRAIAAVERALALFDPPVHVRHAIVHNADVVRRLAAAGAVFVDDLDQVPPGGVVVLGAHGVAASVREEADRRGLLVVDATCPLVAKVHREVRKYRRRGFDVVLVGHAGHDEVIGTLGQTDRIQLVEDVADAARVRVRRPDRVACVTQTTLRPQDVLPVVAELRRRFPSLVRPAVDDVCYATRNRQTAVEWLARSVDVVLIVGDPASSNSHRLCEAAAGTGTSAHLISRAADLQEDWLVGARVVGVSAGASTPEEVVAGVVDELRRSGAIVEEVSLLEEHVTFRLPTAIATVSDRPDIRAGARIRRAPVAADQAPPDGLEPPTQALGRPRSIH
jgi:4-hydroxy-3-methylbut-2-en-1-yl diphosphate reductase